MAKACWHIPQKHVMDNKVSKTMKSHIRDNCRLELVPAPGCHRQNAAEVGMRNFKNHFLSILAGLADGFPPSLWDRLLPQPEITLNLLSVKGHTHGLRICTPQRTIRLQQNATSTNGLQSPSPQKIRLPGHMGISLSRRMVPGNVT